MHLRIIFFVLLLITIACNQENIEVKYTYYDSGAIKEKFIYKANGIVEAFLYAEDSVLLKESTLKNGLKHGKSKTFKENVLFEDVDFCNGIKHGKMKIFDHKTGYLKLINTYEKDTLNGVQEVFREGIKVEERLYLKGVLVLFNQYFTSEDSLLS